jgi:hypothetical protein
VLSVVVIAVLVIGFERDRGWVRITSIDDVAKARVVHVSNLGLFVVAAAPIPVAVSATGPEGRPVSFCPASRTFLDSAGDEFDRSGILLHGPAGRGLDRLAVRIRNDFVDVNPGQVTPAGVAPEAPIAPPRCAIPSGSAPPFLSPTP